MQIYTVDYLNLTARCTQCVYNILPSVASCKVSYAYTRALHTYVARYYRICKV